MLLALDIGNTNITWGVFDGPELKANFRMQTNAVRTADEYFVLFSQMLETRQISSRNVKAAIVSSVVPTIDMTIEELITKGFKVESLWVGPGIKTAMPIRYDNPKEVGADRIVNAVAAFSIFKSGLIVVDFGTATTFDLVSPRGEYLGGAIAPGIKISMEALFRSASKLPRVEFRKPSSVIGKNTVSSMQAGFVFGYVGLVDEIVTRMKKEADFECKCVATGGLATLIAKESSQIEQVDEMLTLKGLHILYKLNS
ncbi:MAG: type III pantothenate kinase [Myxococcota bacterium]